MSGGQRPLAFSCLLSRISCLLRFAGNWQLTTGNSLACGVWPLSPDSCLLSPVSLFFLCFGNPSRRDDGLGPRFAADMVSAGLPGVEIETAYQPAPEHAETLSHHPTAIMVDAAVSGPGPFSFAPVVPDPNLPFSTHALAPGAIAFLARELFASRTRIFLLGIRGYQFDQGEGLTSGARRNLRAAERFVRELTVNS